MLLQTKLCGTNYPISICFIVVNEFCERFSYYGMKALLTLYFLNYLHWDKDLSTAVYHAFSSLCYFTPILGALIADSWLGKFKTIIYLSIVYVIGHVVKSVGAIPTVGNNDVHIALSLLGLILIALGTGGIKPCVAAFGGDQFDEDERQKFFSIFYMSINAGSLLSTVITPILRGDVQCFGGDCYALAFGVPAALMIVALVVFIAGSGMYKRNPPQGNILLEVCNCIGFAIKNRWRSLKSDPQRNHWLDWAEEKYSKRLIQEIKMVLRVLVLYIPLPMFWALFDQQVFMRQVSEDSDGSAVIKPDSEHTLGLLCLEVLTVSLTVFRPLRKMATGMVFAALAFGAATLVEVNVVKTVVDPPPAGNCLLQVFNLANGSISVKIPDSDLFPEPIQYLEVTRQEGKTIFYSKWMQSSTKSSHSYIFICCLFIYLTVGAVTFQVPANYNVSANRTVERGEYPDVSCHSESKECGPLNLGLLDFGASYTVILTGEGLSNIVPHKMEDVKANNVHIAWQIPQYVLITAGEVMFSITGLEFSYAQAPANMKSVLQAGWLLTVAFGNVIVLIVAEGAGLEQWKEFLLFAGLLLGVFFIFSIMAYFYTYVDPDQLDKFYLEGSGKEESDDDNTKKKSNDINLKKTEKSTRL
uniref:Solute carrier family 15 member 2 n=1 Tax=Mastacembelus armatus TaxID=205130 RepID=A0A7N8YJ10_9TELE